MLMRNGGRASSVSPRAISADHKHGYRGNRRSTPKASVQVKISVMLPQSQVRSEQLRQVLFGQDGGLGAVGEGAPFAQQHHALDLGDDFRHVVRYQQNAQSGL